MQVCNVCKVEKDLSSFSIDRTKKGGLRLTCKECANAKVKVWRDQHKLRTTITRIYWQRENRGRLLYTKARYRAARKNAQPAWLSEAQLKQIRELYDQAADLTRQTGVVHQVDHIHPLNGHNFCGLHVPWNLQVLTEYENAAKSNLMPKNEEHLLWEEQPAFRRSPTAYPEQLRSSSTSKPMASTGGLTGFAGMSLRSVLWMKIRSICRCDTKADLICQRAKSAK